MRRKYLQQPNNLAILKFFFPLLLIKVTIFLFFISLLGYYSLVIAQFGLFLKVIDRGLMGNRYKLKKKILEGVRIRSELKIVL